MNQASGGASSSTARSQGLRHRSEESERRAFRVGGPAAAVSSWASSYPFISVQACCHCV